MSDDEAARDRLKKRLPLILITAAGTALFITGRTAKYLFKKVQTPDSSSSSTASPLKLRLRDLSPQKNKAYFLNNKTILSQSPAVMPDKQESFWAFVRGDANKEPLPPPIPGDNFDPVFFTAKAFGIATALVLGTFGAAGWWIAKAMDVHDMKSFTEKMKRDAPVVVNRYITVPRFLEGFKETPKPMPVLDEEKLSRQYQEKGVAGWMEELDNQLRQQKAEAADVK